MKKYIVIAATLLVTYAVNAQVNSIPIIGNKFTFGIDGGLALPSGDFGASTTINPATSTTINGFAKTGSCYDLYAGFKFSKFIGVMAQYGGNNNSINASDIGSGISASNGFTITDVLIGPYLSVTLVKIKIEVKLLGGYVSSNYPTLNYGSSVAAAFQNGSNFGYCAGAKIKYMMLGGMLGIGVGLNYLGSDITYKGVEGTSTTSNKMQIGIIQPTLGVSLDI